MPLMAKVTIRRDGAEFEINDLTFEQVKELVGVNGYGRHAPQVRVSADSQLKADLKDIYAEFVNDLSERGRDFLRIVRQHFAGGIEANTLAGKLGFQDARQIGGLTGGGISKIAKRHGIKVKDIYRAETTFPTGKRTVTFYPGKLLLAMDKEEKPAV
jgi:hypothetical protein